MMFRLVWSFALTILSCCVGNAAAADSFWTHYEARTGAGMEAALDVAEARISEDSEDGEAWAMKALVYANAVDFMEMSPAEASVTADYALNKALEFSPDDFVTLAAYGLARRGEDPPGARARLEHCVSHRPPFPECHNLLGDLLRKTDRVGEAGDVYEQGLERWPDDGELNVSYALYLQESGRPDAGIEWLRKLVEDQPGFPRGHWHLAVMLLEEDGDRDEARRHAVRALEMDRRIYNGEKLLLELLRPER